MTDQPSIPPRQKTVRQPALLERIGGREVVEQAVDRFYDLVEADPELRPLFPEDLGPGREKQKWFIEQWLGGEPRYSERFGHPRLRRRHFPFVISERAAGRWLRHMIQAFRESGVTEPEVAELVAAFGPMAKHMVNADQPVPRDPIGDAFLT
jgi:hemoglobin